MSYVIIKVNSAEKSETKIKGRKIQVNARIEETKRKQRIHLSDKEEDL